MDIEKNEIKLDGYFTVLANNWKKLHTLNIRGSEIIGYLGFIAAYKRIHGSNCIYNNGFYYSLHAAVRLQR